MLWNTKAYIPLNSRKLYPNHSLSHMCDITGPTLCDRSWQRRSQFFPLILTATVGHQEVLIEWLHATKFLSTPSNHMDSYQKVTQHCLSVSPLRSHCNLIHYDQIIFVQEWVLLSKTATADKRRIQNVCMLDWDLNTHTFYFKCVTLTKIYKHFFTPVLLNELRNPWCIFLRKGPRYCCTSCN